MTSSSLNSQGGDIELNGMNDPVILKDTTFESMGGDITINGDSGIYLGTTGPPFLSSPSDQSLLQSKGGDITLNGTGGDIVLLNNSVLESRPVTGNGGNITVNSTGNIDLEGGTLNASGLNGGDITLTAEQDIITNQIETTGSSNQAGNITLTSNNGTIDTTNGVLSAAGAVNGGDIRLQAPGNIDTGQIATFNPGFTGDGGNIEVESTAGTIDTSAGVLITAAYGEGGDVLLTAAHDIHAGDINAISTNGVDGGAITVNLGGQITTQGTLIETENNNITLGGSVMLNNDLALLTDGTGRIEIDGTVDGNYDLTLTSGSGNIAVNGAIGGNAPLNYFTANNFLFDPNNNGIEVNAVEGITTADLNSTEGIRLNSSNGTITTGMLDTSNVGVAGDVTLNALGNITVDGIKARK
ncbi:MAG: hypothetical protein F6K03_16280 [Kamptonema sp. SIO4C4]|nr:hypothetical protein [Kamptonema sp. SIO4C4]